MSWDEHNGRRTFWLPRRLLDRLRSEADQTDRTASSIVRDALEVWFLRRDQGSVCPECRGFGHFTNCSRHPHADHERPTGACGDVDPDPPGGG